MYSLVYQINVVPDPTFTSFWLFVFVGIFFAGHKVVKYVIFVFLFRRRLPSPGIKSWHAHILKFFRSIGSICSTSIPAEPRIFLAQFFSANLFLFAGENLTYGVQHPKYGTSKMSKYFLYFWNFTPGCNLWRWCRGILRKYSANNCMNGSKPFAKILAPRFFLFFWGFERMDRRKGENEVA